MRHCDNTASLDCRLKGFFRNPGQTALGWTISKGGDKMKKKRVEAKRSRRKTSLALAQALGGGIDVLGAAFCALVIILMLFILISLIRWLRQDFTMLFADLGTSVLDAVLVHGS